MFKQNFIKLLSFLNLLDRGQKVSITNAAIYTILIKILVSPFEWASAVTLLVVLLNYLHKRYESNKFTEKTKSIEQQIADEISKYKSEIDDVKSQVKSFAFQVRK